MTTLHRDESHFAKVKERDLGNYMDQVILITLVL